MSTSLLRFCLGVWICVKEGCFYSPTVHACVSCIIITLVIEMKKNIFILVNNAAQKIGGKMWLFPSRLPVTYFVSWEKEKPWGVSFWRNTKIIFSLAGFQSEGMIVYFWRWRAKEAERVHGKWAQEVKRPLIVLSSRTNTISKTSLMFFLFSLFFVSGFLVEKKKALMDFSLFLLSRSLKTFVCREKRKSRPWQQNFSFSKLHRTLSLSFFWLFSLFI